MAEVSPNLHVFESLKNLHSLGDAAIAVLEKSKRQWELEGAECVPSTGGFIVAANHFVRVDNPTNMTGPQKTNDMFEAMGIITKTIRERCPNTPVVWTPSEVPRPEGLFPKGVPPREILQWFAADARFAGVNIIRKTYLSLVAKANDVLPVPHGTKGMVSYYKEAVRRLKEKQVFAVFPEGEVSVSIHKAKEGFGHFAQVVQAPVLPVSIYDQDGVLHAVVSPIIQPPKDHPGIPAFVDTVMRTIAQKLPSDLRGVYS